MLQSLNGLHHFSLHAEDGQIGKIQDLYFDDALWVVRYLVADTGSWLPGRQVLISPASVKGVDWSGRSVLVTLTCEQVKNSPDIATNQPVSRQHELELTAYYGWPSYWTMEPFGLEPVPMPTRWPDEEKASKAQTIRGDPRLRSAHEVRGYHIEALDGSIGHVSDFVFDDESWKIAFMLIDAGTWLHERLVLLKPEWIQSISWEERHVVLGLTRNVIEASPRFVAAFPISTEYADRLLKHYHGTG